MQLRKSHEKVAVLHLYKTTQVTYGFHCPSNTISPLPS